MRVIAGSARGRQLVAPPGERVRPTLDRVREALFSILMTEIEGSSFLDLYAGSGAIGIEALSRGAARAVFVDNHPQSLKCIRKNLETTRLVERGRVLSYRMPDEIHRIGDRFDIVFADPPFDLADHAGLVTAIDTAGLCAEGGQLIVEHGRKSELPESVGRLRRTRERRYGATTLSFYA